MLKTHCDDINEGDDVIVGLGDSFTQGLGTYSLDTWKSMKNPSIENITGQMYQDQQAGNNWVRQLQRNHLPSYKVYNLGINGGGNRATVKEMYLNPLPKNLGNVIVILMATGIERFDFLKQNDLTTGPDWHQKWQTIWPTITDRGPISRIEKEYFEQIWSTRSDVLEFLFTVKDAENFCYLNGYKFLFSSAFDSSINKASMIQILDDKSEHIDMIDWNNYISIPERSSFMDMINQLEHPPRNMHDIHSFCKKLSVPTKYITPCGHWSIEGSKLVALYMYNELVKRNYI